MKITSVILALSAVVALTQAQVDTNALTNGVKSAVAGTAGHVLSKRQATGFDYTDAVVDGAKTTFNGINNGVSRLVGGSATVKRGLEEFPKVADSPLDTEQVTKLVPAFKNVVESALVNEIKKAIQDEAGATLVKVNGLTGQIKDIVTRTVDAELQGLPAKLSGIVGADLVATIQSVFEHVCALIVPDVNKVLQQNEITKSIVLEVPKIADLTLANVLPKVEGIVHSIKPKVDETLGQVGPKVDETLGQVEPKVDETLGQVEPKVDETLGQVQPKVEEVVGQVKPKVDELVGQVKPKVEEVVGQVKPKVDEIVGQVKPKVDEIVGQVKPKVDETVNKVKSTVPVNAPEVPAV
ncbi:hypothetical protein EC968_005807 [Mortierella alpina]|nr:hypothetical protein EC968_005807 [Mortierella alpina]